MSKAKHEGLFWAQNYLHNPTAKIHHPLHKWFVIIAAINPDSRQARYLLIGLFNPPENLFFSFFSPTLAAVTKTLNTNPKVWTVINRLRSFSFLPASKPTDSPLLRF
ncbi:hypothetical protein H6G97_41760 [Nostoc flagelliforme FACHB-838]|uniref:Transposase n=1 Tax=Nostoc flagelliforme FACHB-838 TaxID=2692904 RepID=A0ABR8E1G5_9NOSO|nr:hypothetical protein [Nostoc flagelliforme]MBD2535567.1 hypothetical protein [Nostoc flagelliforme FACHB-838]